MIQQSTDTAVPALMTGLIDHDDPQALVEAHAAAVASGQGALAEQVCRFAAVLGQEMRATTARVGHDLTRCHEHRYDELWAEDEAAEAKLRILVAVPAFKEAIEAMSDEDVDAIWCQYGPFDDGDDD
ncbi:hypothetical protein FV226_05595 [Methylobacterium sp. WL12]|uniref:hypothetical protein n=1 Tax=Methylobacterium sp. WL12 TaxID=2603890 RepID=UPI0011CB3F9F|nr:hypothetical protein [Methylobacterium sp. WL12]TXM74845.1 hypothetical protein FV226_05595 [Methylobacterium sp. WL12]